MGDLSKLSAGYSLLKNGSLWSANGKCKGYAIANPGEASKIDSYVASLVSGQFPTPPSLSTNFGKGLVEMIDGGYGLQPTKITIQGTPQVGSTLTAVVS